MNFTHCQDPFFLPPNHLHGKVQTHRTVGKLVKHTPSTCCPSPVIALTSFTTTHVVIPVGGHECQRAERQTRHTPAGPHLCICFQVPARLPSWCLALEAEVQGQGSGRKSNIKCRRSRPAPHKEGQRASLQRTAKSATDRHVVLAATDFDEAGVLQKLEPYLLGLSTRPWPSHCRSWKGIPEEVRWLPAQLFALPTRRGVSPRLDDDVRARPTDMAATSFPPSKPLKNVSCDPP